MDRAIQQLRRLRRTARALLLMQRGMHWLAVLLGVGLVCALGDYLLRLPGWLRGLIDLIVVGTACFWCWRWYGEVRRFTPSLSTLALRVERVFPAARGHFASAIDFALQPAAYAHPARTADLVGVAIGASQQRMGDVPVTKMIDWRPTLRKAIPLAVVIVVVLIPVMLARRESGLALRRWAMPLGDAQWPTRQYVVADEKGEVAPTDQPLRVTARMLRGYRDGMRTWLHYRVHNADGGEGPWRRLLMTPASNGAGRYDRVLEVGRDLAVDFGRIVPDPLPYAGVSYRIESGDHQTEPSSIRLVPRPVVRDVVLTIAAPIYAEAMVQTQVMRMHESLSAGGQIATATALRGSRIHMRIALNKAVPWTADVVDAALPGLAGLARVSEKTGDSEGENVGHPGPAVAIEFDLNASVKSQIMIADPFGFATLSGRLYRVQAIADTPPRVTIVEPQADEQVLDTAEIALRAVARDDVGIATAHMEVDMPAKKDSAKGETLRIMGTAQTGGRHVETTAHLALADRGLVAGDEVVITAEACDGYHWNGEKHEAVRSGPRRLLIIEPPIMVRQIRRQLSMVRQNAEQTAKRQREDLREAVPRETSQRRITNRIETMANILTSVQHRMMRNVLDGPELKTLVEHASDLVRSAASASAGAGGAMVFPSGSDEDAAALEEAVTESQEQTAESLEALARLLEEGRDMLTMQLTLKRLQREQQHVAEATRGLLPHTAGQVREALGTDLGASLSELGRRQGSIREEMKPLLENMQVTSEAMQDGASPAGDEATAMALREAAATAQRRGLGAKLASAQTSIDANRLAQAGTDQQESLAVMREMLEALEQQQQRRIELLRRRLAELAESIRRLTHQQQGQRARVQDAGALHVLEGPLRTMQANTLSVQRSALQEVAMSTAATALKDAATAQGLAAGSVRRAKRVETVAHQDKALGLLHEALAAVEQQQEAMQADEQRRRREELRTAYLALAKDQILLRDEAAMLLLADDSSRRWTIAMRGAGNRQADIGLAANALGGELGETALFRWMHGRIDQLSQRATALLRTTSRETGTLRDQQRIAMTLETMAMALEDDEKEDAFSDGVNERADGGGGSGQENPINTLAELKLLRGLQEDLRHRTGQFHQEAGGMAGKRRGNLEALADEQKKLYEIGSELLQRSADAPRRSGRRVIDGADRPLK